MRPTPVNAPAPRYISAIFGDRPQPSGRCGNTGSCTEESEDLSAPARCPPGPARSVPICISSDSTGGRRNRHWRRCRRGGDDWQRALAGQEKESARAVRLARAMAAPASQEEFPRLSIARRGPRFPRPLQCRFRDVPAGSPTIAVWPATPVARARIASNSSRWAAFMLGETSALLPCLTMTVRPGTVWD